MIDLEPLLRFWRALDSAFEIVEPAWWGAVVADPRFPAIWDVNYARIETEDPALALADVESALLPVMDRVGVAHAHMVVFHPQQLTGLISEASTRGDRISWDTAMELRRREPNTTAGVRVEEVDPLDPSFWPTYRGSLTEFRITEENVVRQLVRIERDVLLPAGTRWFAVTEEGRPRSMASLIVLEGVGYIDHVVTFPKARRKGYAGAVVGRIAKEARRSRLDHLYLLVERGAHALSLYERLGFDAIGHIAGTLRPR